MDKIGQVWELSVSSVVATFLIVGFDESANLLRFLT